MNPKISIITITYNSEKTLEKTIQSVISQNYDALEYLIIDGASKDHTMDIVNKYRNHISLVISEPDKGISDAFNKGINNATGEIIGIINSDDLLLPNALRTLANSYEKDVDVYRGNTIAWDDQNNTQIRGVPRMTFPVNSLSFGGICHQSTFVAKRTYVKYGLFRPELRFMMDYDLLVRFYNAGAIFRYVEEDLAVSRMGGVTDSHSFWEKKWEVYDIVITNGGFKFVAFVKMLKFILYQAVKLVLLKLFGSRVRNVKYKNLLLDNTQYKSSQNEP